MRVAILHNEVTADASAADVDVLEQVHAISHWLAELGHESFSLGCTLDLDWPAVVLRRERPDLVFNLVESLGGSDLRQHWAAALVHRQGFPYTGVPVESIFLTTHKLLAKLRLHRAGLPTPAWFSPDAPLPVASGEETRFILKAVGEHASVGLDDTAVMTFTSAEQLAHELSVRQARWQRPFFAEEYIEGREFNLSLLDSPTEPEVLPAAEIVFRDFPGDKPRIVGYKAKWNADSFEYRHTVRRFDLPAADEPLVARLAELARRCWDLFHLRGYARVDFRVDRQGNPSILEVNGNCCLSPDAGFIAAVERRGLAPRQAVERIVEAALARHKAGAAGMSASRPLRPREQ